MIYKQKRLTFIKQLGNVVLWLGSYTSLVEKTWGLEIKKPDVQVTHSTV